MMTFITLSCNHHFVTYITYYSSLREVKKINNYVLKSLQERQDHF